MILLNDSNSYWWLVRLVKDMSVGFLPAEHIETPSERLARLNKHRNGEFTSPASFTYKATNDAHAESSDSEGEDPSKSRLKQSVKKRSRPKKSVSFTAQSTYVSASEYDFTDDDGYMEGYSDFEEVDEEELIHQSEEEQEKSKPENIATKLAGFSIAPLVVKKPDGFNKDANKDANMGNNKETNKNEVEDTKKPTTGLFSLMSRNKSKKPQANPSSLHSKQHSTDSLHSSQSVDITTATSVAATATALEVFDEKTKRRSLLTARSSTDQLKMNPNLVTPPLSIPPTGFSGLLKRITRKDSLSRYQNLNQNNITASPSNSTSVSPDLSGPSLSQPDLEPVKPTNLTEVPELTEPAEPADPMKPTQKPTLTISLDALRSPAGQPQDGTNMYDSTLEPLNTALPHKSDENGSNTRPLQLSKSSTAFKSPSTQTSQNAIDDHLLEAPSDASKSKVQDVSRMIPEQVVVRTSPLLIKPSFDEPRQSEDSTVSNDALYGSEKDRSGSTATLSTTCSSSFSPALVDDRDDSSTEPDEAIKSTATAAGSIGYVYSKIHPDIVPIYRETSIRLDQMNNKLDALLSTYRKQSSSSTSTKPNENGIYIYEAGMASSDIFP